MYVIELFVNLCNGKLRIWIIIVEKRILMYVLVSVKLYYMGFEIKCNENEKRQNI